MLTVGQERLKLGRGHLGHAKAHGIDGEVGVVLDACAVVGQGEDAAHRVIFALQRHGVSHAQAGVCGKHTVEGDLPSLRGCGTFHIGGDVHLVAHLVDAHGGVHVASVGSGSCKARGEVEAEERVHVGPELFHGGDGFVGGLEIRGEAAVFHGVVIAEGAHDGLDGRGGYQKARHQGARQGHEQEDAQVFAEIMLELARQALCQR